MSVICDHSRPKRVRSRQVYSRLVLALLLGFGAASGFDGGPETALEQQRQSAAGQVSVQTITIHSVARQAAASSLVALAVSAQQASIGHQLSTTIRSSLSVLFSAQSPSPAFPGPVLASAACNPMPPEQIDPLIQETAQKEELRPELLRAVIEQESAFRPCAVSAKGAMGLMQLMPATALGLGVVDPFDPRENISSGARLLKSLLLRYDGRLEQALGAYNAGTVKADQAGGIPPIPETQRYVPRILDRLR